VYELRHGRRKLGAFSCTLHSHDGLSSKHPSVAPPLHVSSAGRPLIAGSTLTVRTFQRPIHFDFFSNLTMAR
jgi:hypothetical protein